MLYEHQKEALQKLHNGSILVGGVGTGKSRTAIAYYYEKICGGNISLDLKEPSEYIPLYILTTAKKRDSAEWEKELSYFLLMTNNKVQITIDSWNNIEKYVTVSNAFFIFDEQRVVGKGAWARNFIKIAKKNRWILLTATPGDTWTDYIPVFIANGFYKNRSEFIHNHIVYKRFAKFPIIDKFINVDKLYTLKEKICVPMIMIKKTTPHNITVSTEYDKQLYKQCMVYRWDTYSDSPITNISKVFYIARKIINSDISRIMALESLLSELNKVIIFYNFNYELDIIKDCCNHMQMPYTEWNGQRHEHVRNDERWAYIVQYSAGAEGWECITTNNIIFYSQTYSYKTLAQAKGRIDRLNTPFDELYYYHLRCNAPLERAILAALKRKETFNEGKYIREGDDGG